MEVRPLPQPRRLRAYSSALAVGIVVVLAVLWVFWPTLTELAARWGSDSRYSHGYFVPLFAAYLMWARRGLLRGPATRLNWCGLLLLLAGLGMRFAGTYLFLDWLAAIALLPCLTGVVMLGGGWHGLHAAWPAIAFLGFMVPLPFRVEIALAGPLQRVATIASTYVLQTLGFVTFAEGNVICLGPVRIGVVEACSGLSMLVIFFALSTAVSFFIKRPWPIRALVVISAVPIALAANIVRITVTAMLHETVGSEWADYVFHDLAGWLMMPLALGFLWVEMVLVAWIFPQVEERETAPIPMGGILLAGVRPAPRVERPAGKPTNPPVGASDDATTKPTTA
jgi:exosortase